MGIENRKGLQQCSNCLLVDLDYDIGGKYIWTPIVRPGPQKSCYKRQKHNLSRRQLLIANIYSKYIFHNFQIFIPNVIFTMMGWFFVFSRLFPVQDPNFMHTEFQGPLTSPQFYDFWVISWQISQIYLSQKLTSFV